MSKDEDNNEKPNENLPFKNVPNLVAKEIEESYNSHSAVEYKLRKLNLIKPDYCDICKAVSRLHHCQTPIIHQVLKVNI